MRISDGVHLAMALYEPEGKQAAVTPYMPDFVVFSDLSYHVVQFDGQDVAVITKVFIHQDGCMTLRVPLPYLVSRLTNNPRVPHSGSTE